MIWFRTIWFVLTLRCEAADRLRANARRGSLTRSERTAERLHRSLCASCRRAAAQLERIDRGLERLASDVTSGSPTGGAEGLDPERAARLEAALREAGGKG